MSRARSRHTSGSRVGGGRLRVDAARAVHKLRDYQLADGAMWALEAIRAAIAAGASAVHADGDSDDVWIAWEGAPIDHAELPRLLDELVSPQASEERRSLRLLATAVNTALGLGPRWVDVYAIDGGAGLRARYAPHLLTASEEGASESLRRLAATPAALPAGSPAITRGMLVHLRRFPALEALSLLATGQEPRELRLVRRACEDLGVPLRIAQGTLSQHHASSDLIRVRLDRSELGDGRDGFVAITDPSVARSEPWVDYAELGVVVATQPLELALPLQPGARVPLRLRIDAPRMPTNASRSAVRREEPWLVSLERHAIDKVRELVTRLARELGDDAEGTWAPDRRARLRVAAIELAASVCAGADWPTLVLNEKPLHALLAPLFDLPLARDALGRARSIRELARGGHGVVHTGSEPLPDALEAWVGDLTWVPPGDPIARLWGRTMPAPAHDLVRAAKASSAARERWLAHATKQAELERRDAHVITIPLVAPGRSAHSCMPAKVFARPDIAGEVALSAQGPGRANVELLVQGRATEMLRVASPLASDAIATASDLRLLSDHSGVADEPAKRELVLAIEAATVVGCEAIARRLLGRSAPQGETVEWHAPDLDPALAAGFVRAGTRIAVQVLERVGTTGTKHLTESKSPLLDAPAWPTAIGGMTSLAALLAATRARGGVIGHVPAGTRGMPELHGRIVVAIDAQEKSLLELLLGEDALLDYTSRGSDRSNANTARLLRASCSAVIEIDGPGYRGAFGWSTTDTRSHVLTHRGVVLARDGATRANPSHLQVDDDRLVPARGWTGLRHPDDLWSASRVRALEAQLAIAVIDATLGRATNGLHAPPLHPTPTWEPLAALFRTCRELQPSPHETLGRARVDALRALAILPRAFTHARASVDELREECGGEIVFLPPTSTALRGASLADYRPLLADAAVAAGIGHVFQLRVRDGTAEVEKRQRLQVRAQRLAHHRSRSTRSRSLEHCAHIVRVSGHGIEGLLGYDPHGPPRTSIAVLVEDRAFAELTEPLPYLRAIIDVDPTLADDAFEGLSESGIGRIRGAIRESTSELITALIESLDQPIAYDPTALRLTQEWCESPADRKRAVAKKTLRAIRAARIFGTVQKGRASIDDALHGGKTLRVAEAVDRWLGPSEGEPASAFDAPILAYPPDDDAPVRVLLRTVNDEPVRNVTADVRRLQAARRVHQGLAERPRIASIADGPFKWTLEALAEVAAPAERDAFEALGIGEIALADAPMTEIVIFESGQRAFELRWNLMPPVAIACEPSILRVSHRAIEKKDEERLENAARTVIGRMIRHLVETTSGDALPTWARKSLRESALLGGTSHITAIAEVPIFETTADRWVCARELKEQAARFESIWYTSNRACSLVPLDPDRFALRLTASESTKLLGWVPLDPGDLELRDDQLARQNRDRPRVSELGPTQSELADAIAIREIPLDAATGRSGIVLALHPARTSARALRAYRGRHPLGSVDDRASWPTLAWIDDPRFTPDRTWSAPTADTRLSQAHEMVRNACEAAIAQTFPAPSGKLATIRVDRALSDATLLARATTARGILWIELGDEPVIEVVDANGLAERTITLVPPSGRQELPVPVGGRLVMSGAAGAGGTKALGTVVREAYVRMTRILAARIEGGLGPDDDLDVAELVRAAALGVIDGEHPGANVRLPCVPGILSSVGELATALIVGRRALVFPQEQAARAEALASEIDWDGEILIDDGSLTARRAIVAFGERAQPFASALRDRVLDAPEPGPEAPTPFEPIASSPEPQAKKPRAKKSPRASERPAPSVLQPAADAPAPRWLVPERLDALIRARGASGARIAIGIDLLGGSKLAALRPSGEVELSLEHPVIRALERAPDQPEAIAILAAHVIGLATRGDDDAGASELASIAALLKE